MPMQARNSRPLKHSIPVLTVLCLIAVAVPFAGKPIGRMILGAVMGPSSSPTIAFRDVAGSTVVTAAERGSTYVRFDDGVEIANESDAKSAGRPLGMLKADFDNDGVQDLAVATGEGSTGTIRVYRGNLGAIYPNAPEARAAAAAGTPVDAPFLAPPSTTATSIRPEFSVAGDMNGDGNADVMMSTAGSESIVLLPGNGRGGFGDAQTIEVAGKVTALGGGDIDRADGSLVVVVGIDKGKSSSLVIVTAASLSGSLDAEAIAIPSTAREIQVGDITGARFADIVVATDSGAIVVPGRDSAFESVRAAAVAFARGKSVRSIAIGDFTNGPRLDAAVLLVDGSVAMVAGPDPSGRRAEESDVAAFVSDFATAPGTSDQLLAANVSSRPGVDLIALDRTGRSIGIIEGGEAAQADKDSPIVFAATGEPIASVAMRLNPDGLDDLVTVTSDSVTPVVLLSSKLRASFVVTNTNDMGMNSLRDAITQANALAGADSISFNIAGTGPHTISLMSALPVITETLDIDGTTEPDFAGTPVVVLDGSGAGSAHGLDTFGTSGVKLSGFVVRNFNGAGVLLNTSSAAVVEGCFIGTTVAGTTAAPNTMGGVSVSGSTMATVGGTTSAARNVISGNSTQGIAVAFSDGTVIQGNFIGVTSSGNAALGNGLNGVELNESTMTVIGGNVAGTKNVVSANIAGGNLSNGVYDHGGMADGNLVQGNEIGLGADGTTALGNGANGVLVDSNNATIGGPISASAGNFLSSNIEAGVRVESQAFGCAIFGNRIGLDATGNLDRGNGTDGVWLAGGGPNTVGGPISDFGNVISGNQIAGVKVTGGFAQFIGSNTIGLNASGSTPVPNSGDGVHCNGGAGISVVFNKIGGNTGDGIGVVDGTDLDFSENEIAFNGGLGIDLGADGVTPNDPGDGDVGAGDLQNFPVVTSAVTDGGVTMVAGTLNSTPFRDFLIQIYINPTCDGSGFGEGRTYAGGILVSTDSMGDAMFSFNLDVAGASGESITATASELGLPGRSDGEQGPSAQPVNTSEFSACFPVTSLEANLVMSITDTPDPVAASSTITYTMTATNSGPMTADNAFVQIVTPPNTTFESASTSPGWALIQAPSMGGTGPVTFSNPTFVTGVPATLTLVVRVDDFTPGGTIITAMAEVGSDLSDPLPDDNFDTTDTTVQTVANISVDKIADVSSAVPGSNIQYTVTVFGAGSGNATSPVLTDVIPTNTTFQSISTPAGWSAMTPAVNGTGTITATRAQLDLKTTHVFMITVKVDANAPGQTNISNTAVLSASTVDPDMSDNSDTADVLVDAPPSQADLSVSRVPSSDPAVRGQDLTFTVTVTNSGPNAASILTLNETLPNDTTLVSFDLPPGWSASGGQGGRGDSLSATTSSMAPNTSAVFSVVVNVSFLTPDGTFLVGDSHVFAQGSFDPNPSNNTASTSTVVGPPPITDLVLDKTASPTTVTPGSAITYTLVATNSGSSSAADLTITDATPTGTTYVSASPSSGGSLTAPSASGTGTIRCVWPGITLPGESRTLTIVVDVDDTVENGASIINDAVTTSLAGESNFTNNRDSVTVAVSTSDTIKSADVDLSVSTIPDEIDTGERLVYSLTVHNNGPDTAESVLLRSSTPVGTRFVSVTTTQGTISAPQPGGVGQVEVLIGDIPSGSTVTVVYTLNVVAEGGDNVGVDVVIEGKTNDPVAGNNAVAGSTDVNAGNDVLLTWDPPLPTDGDERNPPLHLQTQTVSKNSGFPSASKFMGLRNTLVGYNIYRSNTPGAGPNPANFFTTVPAGTTTVVAPTAPGGSFFVVTANYPNGESDGTNDASGGLPEPDIDSFQIKGNKVILNGTAFTDDVTVFIDGIPFSKTAKVKKENTRVQQKGKLLTGQTVTAYLNQQGGVVLVSVLNSDTGIGTFLYRR